MKQLLIFTDFFGTIDKASVEDFFTLFSLIRKYCDEKGYDNFSFNIASGGKSSRILYSDIFLEVKHKLGETFSFEVYSNLIAVERKFFMDYLIEKTTISKKNNNVNKDNLITKEVLCFDDDPFPTLVAPYSKRVYKENYDVDFNCIVVKKNIYDVIGFFENELIDIKRKGSKTNI